MTERNPKAKIQKMPQSIYSRPLLIIALSLIAIATSCTPVVDTGTAVYREDVADDPVIIPPEINEEYINNPSLHVPDFITGVWETDYGQEWEISSAGIYQPVSCALYPNPVAPGVFLDANGTTEEKIAGDVYLFFGSAMFPYKTMVLYGECRIEIDVGDGTLNGVPAVKK